jgi:hypothetical protein
MLKNYAIKRSEENLAKYPDIIKTFENSYEIVEKTYEKYKKHIGIERIISFLKMFDNLPEDFDYRVVIYYQDKILDRIARLRSEGRHQSIIDITLYEIFSKDKEQARLLYEQMVSNKTDKWSKLSGEVKDAKSLDFHIRKYGKIEGNKIWQEKKDSGYFRKSSNMCIEYYLERGYSEAEAKELIKERQSTGRLDKFIERYGEEEGIERWKERQMKWQKTLNDKPEDEKIEINLSKNFVYAYKKRGLSNEEISEKIATTNMRLSKKLYATEEELIRAIEVDKKNGRIWDGMLGRDAVSFYTQSQFLLLDIEEPEQWLKPHIRFSDLNTEVFQNKGGFYSNFMMRTEEGFFLRSMLEIFTYEKIKRIGLKIQVDKKYPHDNNPGSLRYDFFLEDFNSYIEVSPLYHKSEVVRNKVDLKKKLFGCEIVTNQDEVLQLLSVLINSK